MRDMGVFLHQSAAALGIICGRQHCLHYFLAHMFRHCLFRRSGHSKATALDRQAGETVHQGHETIGATGRRVSFPELS